MTNDKGKGHDMHDGDSVSSISQLQTYNNKNVHFYPALSPSILSYS